MSASSASNEPVQPWVMDAYAPGGAAVSTTRDLAKLATALLDGTAPGMAAGVHHPSRHLHGREVEHGEVITFVRPRRVQA